MIFIYMFAAMKKKPHYKTLQNITKQNKKHYKTKRIYVIVVSSAKHLKSLKCLLLLPH